MTVKSSFLAASKRAKIAIGAAALVFGGFLISSLLPSSADQSGGRGGVVRVVAAEVAAKSFHDRIEALGTLRANESVELSSNVTDTITSLHFDDNQRVEAGFVLAEMTNNEQQAQLQEARSTLTEAQKQYERVRTLAKQGNVPRARLDEQKREVDTAKARLAAVQSRLKDRLIVAPFNGVVGLRTLSAGALVKPGDVIATLDDDAQMKLDFSVPAVFVKSMKVGLPIEARSGAYGEDRFRGEITSIDSRIDPVTRAFQVRAVIPNPNFLLKHGMLMQVEIQASPREALVVPESALEPSGTAQFVYTLLPAESDSDTPQYKVAKTEVVIGARRPGEVEILSGLSAGDAVVIDGTMKLQDGALVQRSDKAF